MKRWVLRFAAGAAVSGLILAALLSFTDTRAVGRMLARTDPIGALAGFVLYALSYVPRAQRFRAVGLQAPFRALLAISCVHAAFNKVLPLRAGELSYPWLARRVAGQGIGQAFLGLVYLRILDFAGVAVLFAASLALSGGRFRGDVTLSLALAVALLIGSIVMLLFLRPLLRVSIALGERLFGPRRILERARRSVAAFPALGLSAHLKLGALTLVAWLLVYGTYYTLLGAFGFAMGAAETVLGSTAGVVASVLPLQGLGSFGTLEAGWALGMALVGMDLASAIATGLGVQVLTFGYAMLLGVLGGWGLRRPSSLVTSNEADRGDPASAAVSVDPPGGHPL